MIASRSRSLSCPLAILIASSLLLAASCHGQVRLKGKSGDRRFGAIGGPIGDVNKDGVGDLAIGPGGFEQGYLIIYSGKTLKPLYTLEPTASSLVVDCSVHPVGDINKDGHADFVTRSWWGSTQRTTVELMSGKDGTLIRRLTILDSGKTNIAFAHFAVDAGGDVNRDRVPDVVVTSADSSNDNFGLVQAFGGADGKVLWSAQGSTRGEQLGIGLAFVGDLNADGHDDVVAAGKPTVDSQNKRRTVVRVISGKDGSFLHGIPFTPPASGGYVSRVAALGDLNADGRPDFAVGLSWLTNSQNSQKGGAVIYSGKTYAPIFTVHGLGLEANLVTGATIAPVGDINQDGTPDFSISGFDPTVAINSGKDGSVLMKIPRTANTYPTLRWCHGLGDIDQDGRQELLVRGPMPTVSNVPGEVFVLDVEMGSYKTFGSGCRGTVSTPQLEVKSVPRIAETFELQLSNLLFLHPTGLLIGLSDKQIGNFKLPLDLNFMGMPGCTLYVSAELIVPIVPNATQHIFKYQVPPVTGLIGATFYNQLFIGDLRANPAGLIVSNAGKGTVGG